MRVELWKTEKVLEESFGHSALTPSVKYIPVTAVTSPGSRDS